VQTGTWTHKKTGLELASDRELHNTASIYPQHHHWYPIVDGNRLIHCLSKGILSPQRIRH